MSMSICRLFGAEKLFEFTLTRQLDHSEQNLVEFESKYFSHL